ncbi:MAG: Asp23/Gls24 family envelope stress response protein [Clostridia bacterium]|nr:Asp23/Gls24 family envelope stress response protein [Clostridia bacterium]
MQVYGFVGPSGTGKSYRVTEVAKANGVPYIIDDGLLIRDNKVLAGISAKRESTKIASVKRALFFAPTHAAAVKRSLAEEEAEKLMIVGTSVAMINKIAEALCLPAPEKIIHIEDVSTKEEIAAAQHSRLTEGKHVIPVPTFAVKKDFSGYFLDPLQIFRPVGKRLMGEKTVVRPTYSYLGEFKIANSVLITIGAYEAKRTPSVTKVWTCGLTELEKSVVFHLDINLQYGSVIPKCAGEVQKRITEKVENLTGIVVDNVEITVRQLDY